MKQHLSRTLRGVAYLYFSFPVTYVLSTAILFDIASDEWVLVFLSPVFYAVAFLAVLTGYGLKEMRRWSWYLLLITNGAIIYETAILAATYGDSHNKLLAFCVFVLGILVLTYRISREVRVPYFFPRIRWWESDPRFKVSIPAIIVRKGIDSAISETEGGAELTQLSQLEGEILDLSLGGCFVKSRESLPHQEAVRIFFQAFGTTCEARGMVVWTTESSVTRPKGIGIKFTKPSVNVKRSIKQIIHSISQLNRLHKRNLNEDERARLLAKIDELRIPMDGLPTKESQSESEVPKKRKSRGK